ncbi:MAG: hypothetical protein AAF267_03445 [Deinococcota bacterium]
MTVNVNLWARDEIKRVIKERGLSHVKLAEQMEGVSATRISNVLAPYGSPKLDLRIPEQFSKIEYDLEVRETGSGLPALEILPDIFVQILEALEIEIVLVKRTE